MGETSVDIIVGIPSYNEADSISFVTRQADLGLAGYFPHLRCKIVNVDNNSPDNTREAFLNTETTTEKVYLSTSPGVTGKGNNFFNLFSYARQVGATSVIVVDADLKSITPEWIERLATPTLNGKAFVSPLYLRHKYDGTITNNLVFPLVFSLLNMHVRQPIGGDFSVRADLIEHYLAQEWTDTIRQYGVDVFMTMHALLGGFPIEQVHLGAKIHKPSAPKLGPMFVQVIMTLFDLLTTHMNHLPKNFNGNRPQKNYTLPNIEPPDINIDAGTILAQAQEEFGQHREWLSAVLDRTMFKRIESAFSGNDINIDADFWAEIVFTFLDIYPRADDRVRLVDSFKSLYWGRAYSFISRTQELSSSEAEEDIINQACIFWDKRARMMLSGD